LVAVQVLAMIDGTAYNKLSASYVRSRSHSLLALINSRVFCRYIAGLRDHAAKHAPKDGDADAFAAYALNQLAAALPRCSDKEPLSPHVANLFSFAISGEDWRKLTGATVRGCVGAHVIPNGMPAALLRWWAHCWLRALGSSAVLELETKQRAEAEMQAKIDAAMETALSIEKKLAEGVVFGSALLDSWPHAGLLALMQRRP
jgi:hypothetical protein